ncbi:MAG TPA: anthrone oxygenase family protein [Rhizomicrobium sp.]|jgi:hypothetical protein|nr:anthrone oxygenase family protein [Rhizomicrobium sp.]
MKWLRNIALVVAFLATTVPIAHVLEMPSKFALDGPVWLSVQQHLYRGWGGVFWPIEILALVCSIALFSVSKGDRENRGAYLIATVCYLAVILYLLLFNDLVNDALSRWTAATMPADWAQYRLKWETGHALAALFSLFAFVTLMRTRIRDRVAMPAE